MSSATEGHFALDANPKRLVVLEELLTKTDPDVLSAAINALTDHNRYTDADKALVQELNKFKGEHADESALEAAFPAADQPDDAWARNEDTDSVWVVDSATGAWKDTNTNTAPAAIDNSLNKTSSNAVSNQAISLAMEQREVSQVFEIPGDGTLASFNIVHTLATTSSHYVRKKGTEEAISLKTIRSNANTIAVGPFATPPADSTLFELVVKGTSAI